MGCQRSLVDDEDDATDWLFLCFVSLLSAQSAGAQQCTAVVPCSAVRCGQVCVLLLLLLIPLALSVAAAHHSRSLTRPSLSRLSASCWPASDLSQPASHRHAAHSICSTGGVCAQQPCHTRAHTRGSEARSDTRSDPSCTATVRCPHPPSARHHTAVRSADQEAATATPIVGACAAAADGDDCSHSGRSS